MIIWIVTITKFNNDGRYIGFHNNAFETLGECQAYVCKQIYDAVFKSRDMDELYCELDEYCQLDEDGCIEIQPEYANDLDLARTLRNRYLKTNNNYTYLIDYDLTDHYI